MNYEQWIDVLEDPQALLKNLEFVSVDDSVEVDIEKFDKGWSLDKVCYMPPKGIASSQRKLRFVDFLREGEPIIIPDVSLLPDNIPHFDNGRHRFSVLRDLGLEKMPMAVDDDHVNTFRRLFGLAS